MSKKLTLISFPLCPYVQRSVIALEEKGVDYEIEYIDLTDKPDWFLEKSPLGKVPLLLVGEDVLFESAVIAEYIEEVYPEPRLHPKDPLRKAKHRAWIELASTFNADLHRMAVATEKGKVIEICQKVKQKLQRFEEIIEAEYFSAEGFSLVDASIAPALMRLNWIDELKAELELFDGLTKVSAWKDVLLQRKSVKASTLSDIKERYLAFLKGNRGKKKSNEEPSWIAK